MPIDGLTEPHLPPTIVHMHESRRVSGQPSNRGAGYPDGRGKVLVGQQPSAFRNPNLKFRIPNLQPLLLFISTASVIPTQSSAGGGCLMLGE